jgi:hypothetical protein
VCGLRASLCARVFRKKTCLAALAAKGIQITQTGISKLENRQRYVMDYEALAIAKALRLSVSWLYGESKNIR